MADFTKGEWTADNGESELWGIFQKEDCQGIAYLCEPDGTLLRPEEAEANAHLIVAAPDMYETLQKIMAMDDSGVLEACAYSGGDISKKWMREVAPALDARSKARKEIQAMIKPILAKAEGKEEK